MIIISRLISNLEIFMSNRKYSFIKGLIKAIVSMILVGLPILIQILPSDIANLTIGGVLVLALNFLKTKYF